MKATGIIITALMLPLMGCRHPAALQQPPVLQASLPALEAGDGQKVEITGIVAADPVPSIIVTSHRVANGRNLIRLHVAESQLARLPGEGHKITVTGVLRAGRLKVPELDVERIEGKQ